MGYSGLNKVGDSDVACDLQFCCEQAYLKELAKGLKVKENEHNTSGWINVALIIESGSLDNFMSYSKAFEDFPWAWLVARLEKEVIESSAKYRGNWACEKNRIFHNTAFKRMLKNVKNFLDKKEVNWEDELVIERFGKSTKNK